MVCALLCKGSWVGFSPHMCAKKLKNDLGNASHSNTIINTLRHSKNITSRFYKAELKPEGTCIGFLKDNITQKQNRRGQITVFLIFRYFQIIIPLYGKYTLNVKISLYMGFPLYSDENKTSKTLKDGRTDFMTPYNTLYI